MPEKNVASSRCGPQQPQKGKKHRQPINMFLLSSSTDVAWGLDKRTSQSQPPAHPARVKDRALLSQSHLLIKQLWALFP